MTAKIKSVKLTMESVFSSASEPNNQQQQFGVSLSIGQMPTNKESLKGINCSIIARYTLITETNTINCVTKASTSHL